MTGRAAAGSDDLEQAGLLRALSWPFRPDELGRIGRVECGCQMSLRHRLSERTRRMVIRHAISRGDSPTRNCEKCGSNSLLYVHNIEYPRTRIDPVAEPVSEGAFVDPYRWLEGEGDEVLRWQREQSTLATDHVSRIAGFDELRSRVDHFLATRPSLPKRGGDQWFRLDTRGDTGVVLASTTPFGPGREVFDVSAHEQIPLSTVTWLSPSPNGDIIAIGVCPDGSERTGIRLIDVGRATVLSAAPTDIVPDSWAGGAWWLPDSSGFYFQALRSPTGGLERVLYHYDLATQMTSTVDVGQDLALGWAVLTSSHDGDHIVLHHWRLTGTLPIAVRGLPDGAWRPFVTGLDGNVTGHIVDGRFIGVTDIDAPRGRVVEIPLSTPTPNDPTTWREIIPESDAVIRSLAPVGDVIYVHELVDTWSRVRIVDRSGRALDEVALPDRGTVAEDPFKFMNVVDHGLRDEYMFAFSTLTSSWGVYSHRHGQRELLTVTEPAVKLTGAVVSDHWATSADGTSVPYHIVRRADVSGGPSLLYAYGSSGVPLAPQFPGSGIPAFVEAGGTFVHAHIRGGGEFGREWAEGGVKANKQNGYDDLYAIAEDLIDRGVAEPRQLAVVGGSMGGLMAAVAATQRPELWGACVPLVPLTDLIGNLRLPYGYRSFELEFGDPTDPDDLERAATFSPYQLVRDGVGYPATFIVAGDTDHRCAPWHGRKLAARLQAANSAETPILVHIWEGAGHGWAGSRTMALDQATEWLAFVIEHTGLAGTTPVPSLDW